MGNSMMRCLLVFVLTGACVVATAQTKSKTTKSSKATADKVKAKESAKELTGRLPRFFSTLVDDKQRQEVYGIQADYRSKIEALEKQLEELREKEMAAMEKVLTTTQRKKLSDMRKTGASKTASSSKTTKARTVSAKKPSSKSSSSKSTKSSSKSSSTKSKK